MLRRLGGVLIALTALLTAVTGTSAPSASAAPVPPAAPGHERLPHPGRDWMGSSVAAHERLPHPGRDWMGSSVKAHEGLPHPDRDWMGSSVKSHQRPAGRAVSAPSTRVTRTPGFDVSNWQGTIDWPAAYAKGAKFAYIKATEGTTYKDPYFGSNYTNSYYAGFIRGAYHFATPNTSSGTAQADWFVSHGGSWSKDGKTLPPLLDIEYPDGAACYGLSQSAMRSWITAFINRVHTRTGRWATIYTTTDWWKTCTGNTAAYATHDPLFIARYASTAGTLPAGWPYYTFWQHADSGTFPGDQDYFNGPLSGLRNLANNT